jgi:serine/threonine protein kinase
MIETGTILQNRYLVLDKIGAGGMGAVYLATDQRFNSQVAIKETFFSELSLRRAFEREAQLLNSLRHPALPRVSDHFEEADGQFLVMEYIAGEDLSEILDRSGTFAVGEVLLWADQLLDALEYLHGQKIPIVHRDIKPQNLKLTPRRQIVLLDFGLAKGSITDVSKLTQTKSVFGYSRAYAPLEQIQGTGTDPRSDLYSLAATLYHLLTGAPPTDALTRAMAVLNGGEDTLRLASELNRQVPVSVAQALQKSMSLNAAMRPPSAAAMRELLAEAANNADFDDSASIANQTSASLFTQNTELIGGQTKDGNQTAHNANRTAPLEAGFLADAKDSDATKFSKTNLKQPQFTTDPQSAAQVTRLEETENLKRSAPFNVPVDSPAVHDSVSTSVPKNRSLFKPIGIAAAIAILAGGGFAGWYAMNDSSSNSTNFQPVQTQSASKSEAQKPETNKDNTNIAVVTPVTPEVQTAVTTNSTDKNSASVSAPSETKPEAQTIIVEKNGKQPNAQPKPVVQNTPQNKVTVIETRPNVVDEVLSDVANDMDMDLKNLRVEDIPGISEKERQEIRNALKMHNQLQTRRKAMERVNRRRAEKGLPPIHPPIPPPAKNPQTDDDQP